MTNITIKPVTQRTGSLLKQRTIEIPTLFVDGRKSFAIPAGWDLEKAQRAIDMLANAAGSYSEVSAICGDDHDLRAMAADISALYE